jgi:hypothetical protein
MPPSRSWLCFPILQKYIGVDSHRPDSYNKAGVGEEVREMYETTKAVNTFWIDRFLSLRDISLDL